MFIRAFVIAVFAAFIVGTADAGEAELTTIYCEFVGGQEEVRYEYPLGKVFVDCETTDSVIEAGLDKRSSLDSVQQAVFFSTLVDKKPVVVIYDTDGVEGQFEFRIKTVCKKLGIEFLNPFMGDTI